MPLYEEGLLSEETRDYVDWHLESCSSCREAALTANVHLPSSPQPQAEEETYKSAKVLLTRARNALMTTALVIIGLMLVIAIGAYGLGSRQPSIEPVKVSSADDYASQYIPGWERAADAGVIVELGISREIEGTSATFTVEKAWFSDHYIYLLYTIQDTQTNRIWRPATFGLDQPPTEYLSNNPGYVTVDGRLYGGKSRDGHHHIMRFEGYSEPPDVDSLVLRVENWIFYDKSPYETDAVNVPLQISVPYSWEQQKEPTETVYLNEILLTGDRNLRLTKLEVGTSTVKLFGEAVVLPDEDFLGINASQWTCESIMAVAGNTNKYLFTLERIPLDTWPQEFEFKIDSMEIRTRQEMMFTLDWSKIRDRKQLNRKKPGDPDAVFHYYDSVLKLHALDEQREIQITTDGARNKGDLVWNSRFNEVIASNEHNETVPPSNGFGWQDDKTYIFFGPQDDLSFWENSKRVNLHILEPIGQIIIDETVKIQP
jgi:hypothetical protein